ncbi:N-acetylmuramoyl-L-alanine amidase [Caldithrix abyssi]
MNEIDLYISVLLKFLTASLLLERVIEFFDKFLTLIGVASGKKNLLMRLADIPFSYDEQSQRTLKKVLLVQTAGIIIGTAICYFSGLGILKELKLVDSVHSRWFDILLSGIFISGGSEPIHQLINFLKGHKEQLAATNLKKMQEIGRLSSVNLQRPGQKIGITYQGGLYPDRPGHGLRKANPSYIVIHHSGTSTKASFEDVVNKEKQERKNARGAYRLDPSFHSVITYDGVIHNYCRWDSIGWHVAKGPRVSNANSLGLCFVGNFRNRSSGKNKPSEQQIEAGARLLALWRYLYDIEEKNVVRHSDVRRGKIICPGENFPMERLVARSTQLLKSWKQDDTILKELEQFKKQRYIYV